MNLICKKYFTVENITSIKLQKALQTFFERTLLMLYLHIKMSILELSLFYDNKLLIGNKNMFLNSWFKAGVYYIVDMFDSYGAFLSLEDFNDIFQA
jgi:hypothetical protein